MKDEAIVELYWQRNENAIRATEEKYSSYLYRIGYNILSDEEDTKESVNDTYLAAWNSMPPNRPAVLSTYLGKLIRRISIDIFRRKNRDKRKPSEYALSISELYDCTSAEPTPDELLDEKLLSTKIGEFLREQKPEVRRAFIGRYYYFDSVADIARYCHMTKAKTKTVLFRARAALKDYLEKEGYKV